MSLLKNIAFSLLGRIRLGTLQQFLPELIIIPFQHLISDSYLDYISPLYSFKSLAAFENDLDFLLANFTPVSLTGLIDTIKQGRPLAPGSFLLTFDDGFSQIYTAVVPILLRKGLGAAFFVNPAFVDNKVLFYDLKKGLILDKLLTVALTRAAAGKIAGLFEAENAVPNRPDRGGRQILTGRQNFLVHGATSVIQGKLIRQVRLINYHSRILCDHIGEVLDIDFDQFLLSRRPFMTSNELQILADKGFHLGAHSIDHPLYSLLTLEEQLVQTRESVSWVADKFNLSYRAFAFPHTDYGVSSGFFEALETGPVTGRPDIILGNRTGRLEKNPKVFHRFAGENPALPLSAIINTIQFYQLAGKVVGLQYLQR